MFGLVGFVLHILHILHVLHNLHILYISFILHTSQHITQSWIYVSKGRFIHFSWVSALLTWVDYDRTLVFSSERRACFGVQGSSYIRLHGHCSIHMWYLHVVIICIIDGLRSCANQYEPKETNNMDSLQWRVDKYCKNIQKLAKICSANQNQPEETINKDSPQWRERARIYPIIHLIPDDWMVITDKYCKL